MGDPSKHKNAPLCSSALVDGSVSATTQQQPTAIMNYQPHQQQQSSQEWCDHVLIKWHDSWLNHVLISQLPWLHELQLHFKWTWHFAQSYYPLTSEWVLQRQDRCRKNVISDQHSYTEDTLCLYTCVESKYWPSAELLLLHHVLHNLGFLCSVQNVRGYVMSWIGFNWNGRVTQVSQHMN